MNIEQRLAQVMPPDVRALLHRAASLASEQGWSVYLVGGYVRDFLLKIPDYDIDLSVEGDAPALAAALALETGAQLEVHPDFGTAVLVLDGGPFDIDIVTARREWYERPGALPTVEAGTILDDLARRDFTVNAMAVPVLPGGSGEILDPHGGLADLKDKLIRVLHDGSFIDDPTRIFRAVKLAERLGFKIAQHTLELILLAVRDDALAAVSMERITHELLMILGEPRGGRMLATLENLGVLRAVHPYLYWPYSDGRMGPDEGAQLTSEERRDTYLAVLGSEFDGAPDDAGALGRDLRLPTPLIKLVRDSAALAGRWEQLRDEAVSPSQTFRLLRDLGVPALEAFTRIGPLSADTEAYGRLRDYLDRLRTIKAPISGDYLRQLGVAPGPIYRDALDDLLYATLDGQVRDKEQAEQFIRQWLAERGIPFQS